MQCGVGQFTRRLAETIEKLSPGSTTTLTLTRDDGTLAGDLARDRHPRENIVCNFPIVAWKRVILLPLLALAMARLRGRRVILIQHEWAGLHRLRRITYMPALLLADTHRDVLAAGATATRRRSPRRLDRAKMRAGAAAAEHRARRPVSPIPNCASG